MDKSDSKNSGVPPMYPAALSSLLSIEEAGLMFRTVSENSNLSGGLFTNLTYRLQELLVQ